MTTNGEDRSESGAADPLGMVIEQVLKQAYSKTAEEKMTLEAGTVSCLVNELKTLRFIQATANAELRAEVERLREAAAERPILVWMAGTDSGASSESLACCHLGLSRRWGWSDPLDDSDFGRCYRLLLRFPEIRPCVDKLARQHQGWARLATIWDELMKIAEEDGLSERGKSSDRIYARIQSVRWPDCAALAPKPVQP
jgi:hypothetical protein